MMDGKKEVAKLVRKLKKNGFRVELGGKHYKVLDTNGTFLFGMSITPSHPKCLRRIRADVRKHTSLV